MKMRNLSIYFLIYILFSFTFRTNYRSSNPKELIKSEVYLIDTIDIDTLYISTLYSENKHFFKKSIMTHSVCSELYMDEKIDKDCFTKDKKYYIYINTTRLEYILNEIKFKKNDNSFALLFYDNINKFVNVGRNTNRYFPVKFKDNYILVGHKYFCLLISGKYLIPPKCFDCGKGDNFNFKNLENTYFKVLCPIPM